MTLELHHVHKAYDQTVALHALDLTISAGITAILGPNGSGKSTLLRLLATAIEPDAGTILWNGYAYTDHRQAVRNSLGFLPQTLDFSANLTPRRLWHYLARLRGCDDAERIALLLHDLHITSLADNPLRTLSQGETRLVGVGQACLNAPHLLLLDELTTNLSIDMRETVFRFLRTQHQPGQYLIFSTHIIADVAQMADQVIILKAGRVVFTGSLPDLQACADGVVRQIAVSREQLAAWTTAHPVTRIQSIPHSNEVTLRLLSKEPIGEQVEPTLEEAYLHCLQDA